MTVKDPKVFAEANRLLKQLYGENAQFREGQYEAIEAALVQHRTLVVQKTGWGKSLVYFLTTKMLRNQGKGVTLVVSPLLVLMQNQMEAAEKLGLRCAQLNSTTSKAKQWDGILSSMANGTLDLVFVTPKSLFNKEIQAYLPRISIGLFVIDEAHCISTWGHDFILEYGRLKEVISKFPSNVPVLATTATANDQVIEDLEEQLGQNVYLSRGPLARESLHLQVLHLESRAERYAWILENLDRLPGSGIIYCLTVRDCIMLANFLNSNGITAEAYYSGVPDEEAIVERFHKDQMKVIVATIKLGMGYDKDNISFVIHYQMAEDIISYYQQIGRAGRNIPRADIFLMSGKEDEEIIEYFIRTAFPTRDEMNQIMECLREKEGASVPELELALNFRKKRIEKALMFLFSEGFVFKDGSKFYITRKDYVYPEKKYRGIQAARSQAMEQMKELTHTKECLSKYIIRSLNDPDPQDCGSCVNCTGTEILPGHPSMESTEAALVYLNEQVMPIKIRKKWPSGVWQAYGMKKSDIAYLNQEGICLSKYGDPGWGALVKEGKYSREKRFSEDLVEKSAQVLGKLAKEKGIRHITCVPSLRSDLVKDFSIRLAKRMGLEFVDLLCKSSAKQQKEMENSAYQCRNALGSFSVADGAEVPEKLILVDDIVDSKWTLTVCGYRLMEDECEEVYPFALADSGHGD